MEIKPDCSYVNSSLPDPQVFNPFTERLAHVTKIDINHVGGFYWIPWKSTFRRIPFFMTKKVFIEKYQFYKDYTNLIEKQKAKA